MHRFVVISGTHPEAITPAPVLNLIGPTKHIPEAPLQPVSKEGTNG